MLGRICSFFYFHHETKRFSRGGVGGRYIMNSPRDQEICSWWGGGEIYNEFTTRPRDFLMVVVGGAEDRHMN